MELSYQHAGELAADALLGMRSGSMPEDGLDVEVPQEDGTDWRDQELLEPDTVLARPTKRMSSLTTALPFPASEAKTRTRRRVNHRNSEEAELVRRVQAHDEIAFREIVERYQAKVFSIIYGILRNRNDAEDIAQQVFAKIYVSVGKFDFRSSLLTWIYKITVNECYDYLRKKRVRKLTYESDFSEDDARMMENVEQSPEKVRPVDETLAKRDLIMKLLEKISEEERNLILLKEVEGHSVEELAQMTGMNQNTIKVKLFRARQKLQKAALRISKKSQSTVA
jgi:RNA polymerase sigma-70 factor, ECF subfamily